MEAFNRELLDGFHNGHRNFLPSYFSYQKHQVMIHLVVGTVVIDKSKIYYLDEYQRVNLPMSTDPRVTIECVNRNAIIIKDGVITVKLIRGNLNTRYGTYLWVNDYYRFSFNRVLRLKMGDTYYSENENNRIVISVQNEDISIVGTKTNNNKIKYELFGNKRITSYPTTTIDIGNETYMIKNSRARDSFYYSREIELIMK